MWMLQTATDSQSPSQTDLISLRLPHCVVHVYVLAPQSVTMLARGFLAAVIAVFNTAVIVNDYPCTIAIC